MAFGNIVNRWRILKNPLQTDLTTTTKIFMCITHLHNFCINMNEDDNLLEDDRVDIQELWVPSDLNIESTQGTSLLRDIICDEINDSSLVRPLHNIVRNTRN